MNKWYVYILRCDNGTLYTGYTNDMDKRYAAHCNGTGSKYTRSFKPTGIAQCWLIDGDKALAMHFERVIKKMSRKDKEKMIENPASLSELAIPVL